MSIRHFIGSEETQEGCDLALMSEAQSQASDTFVIQRAKELLADLWTQGRITQEVYATGTVALCAALYAIEHPHQYLASCAVGAREAAAQAKRELEAKGKEF